MYLKSEKELLEEIAELKLSISVVKKLIYKILEKL